MKKYKKLKIFFLLGLLASILSSILYFWQLDFFDAIELKLKDVRFKTRSFNDLDNRVVVVAIDEKSINELGRWPWDRKIIAKLIDRIRNYGAQTIALDIVFSESSNVANDSVLSNSINRKNNVVLGYFFREGRVNLNDEIKSLFESKRVKIIKTSEGIRDVYLPSYDGVELNIPVIEKSSSYSGFFNIIPDRDGIIRKQNLLLKYNGFIYPSIALASLKHFLNQEIVLELEIYGVKKILLGDKIIPVDEFGRVTINYYDKTDSFRVYSAVDVINRKLEERIFENAIVFVGATEIGVGDVRATPVNPVLPGIFIHATVASNILKNHVLIKDGIVTIIDVLFIVTLGLILSFLLNLTSKTLVGLIIFVVLLIIYYITNSYIFQIVPFNTSIFYPLLSIVLTYLFCETYRNLVEERQTRFLKKAFSSYVSPELVNEVIKNPEILRLGGQKKEVTILFSDIRGFTTLSEQMEPEALVQLLNSYLSPMTNIILKNGGTLDKYIGDAIMALFNAPLDLKEHANLCCKSALMMIEKLGDVNREFKDKGFPEINIGIGINTGMVIVGNMGTDIRFDYTAIGDTVNLASRLEGMNKIYGTNIIISEFTAKKIDRSIFKIRQLDVIRVKGKTIPISIYELSNTLDDGLIKKYEEAFSLYLKKDFFEAKKIYEELYLRFNDYPSFVFLERCENYIKNPPESEWQGVFDAKTK
ncbi:MAG: adenylate/guanylate cyclase domain-containing protein [Proteobacteria bacterium]|nr:adenylate/guanylate cyclase domain-containing protein [Pseudomonadota bacterium]